MENLTGDTVAQHALSTSLVHMRILFVSVPVVRGYMGIDSCLYLC